MADDTDSLLSSSESSSAGSSAAGRSPLDDLEDGDPFEGEDPFGGADPFGSENPFGGQDPFSGGDPLGGGLPFSENDSPTVMMVKLWISQNPLLSVGAAFAVGTLIGALKR